MPENMKCEFHCHTHYSLATKIRYEGIDSPTDVIKYAKRVGLDAIAITDHDTMNGIKEAVNAGKNHGIIVIPGCEITAANRVHCIALGIQEVIPKGLSIEETLDRIRQQGGIAISPHPFDIQRKGAGNKALGFDGMEVFNALSLDRLSNRRAQKYYQKLYKVNTECITPIASTDAHCKEMLGYTYTLVNNCSTYNTTNNILDNILKAVKLCKTTPVGAYVPIDIVSYWVIERFKKSYDNVINYVNDHYIWPKRVASKKLLSLVNYSPGKIDYLFKLMMYVGIGASFGMSAARSLKK